MKTTIYTVDTTPNRYWYFNGEKWRWWSGKQWLDSVVRDFRPGDLNKLVTVNNFKDK